MATTPFPSNESPDEVIDRLCRELTSDDNVIVVRQVKERFNAWLQGHPDIVTARSRDVSGAMVDSFMNRRRPKLGAGQLGLFRPHALVPIGFGKRAWMDDLSRDQFTMWRDIETTAFGQTAAVFDGKAVYWRERLDQWGSYDRLGLLEREVFNWTEDQIVDDDEDDHG